MSMVFGLIMEISRKQKINGKSSTKFKIVGEDKALSQFLWSRNFIEGQGYEVEDLDFLQDNMRTMLMENNSKKSSTKCTNHIRVRYFFLNDIIENGELYLKYCMTGEIYKDFFTKPLQVERLLRLRDNIQGIPRNTPDVDLICPRALAKFISQECHG